MQDAPTPVVFDTADTRGFTTNGWVVYAPDFYKRPGVDAAAQAVTYMAKTQDLLDREAAKMDRQAAANRAARMLWLNRLAQQTDLRVQAALGTVGDVVQMLLHGASRRAPLSELATMYFEARGVDPATCDRSYLLIQDVSSDVINPKIAEVYGQVQEFIHEDAARLERLRANGQFELQGGQAAIIDDSRQPESLFQVAIDPPSDLSLAVVEEIIATLGKRHAYAIVGSGQMVAPLLTTVVDQEKLTSYIILKDPDMPSMPAKLLNTLHTIMQPTLVLMDWEDAPPQSRATARLLEATLSNYSCPTLPHPAHPKDMAREIISFLRASSWMGSLPTNGTDPDRPVLTRMTGGIFKWRGVMSKQQHLKNVRDHAHRGWTIVRTAFKMDAFKADSALTPQLRREIRRRSIVAMRT